MVYKTVVLFTCAPRVKRNGFKMGKGYKKLIAWQKADELAYQIYLKTMDFPKKEIYGITSQVRRSAVSIPTNIAEGMGRQNKKESRHYINIAMGSLMETEYLLGFCFRLKFLSKDQFDQLENLRDKVGALLWGLYKSF